MCRMLAAAASLCVCSTLRKPLVILQASVVTRPRPSVYQKEVRLTFTTAVLVINPFKIHPETPLSRRGLPNAQRIDNFRIATQERPHEN